MSSLITNPMSQFINPFFGVAAENAKIFIGKVNTDALNPDNRQDVYLMQRTDEATLNKVSLPQPLLTNSAGVIVYNGMPITPWADGAYSITIIGYDGAELYQSFYVDDPTYWLRLDLATMPTDSDPDKGWKMVAGVAPIDSPAFTGDPTAPTPLAGDNDTSIATTAFVQQAVDNALTVGILGTICEWSGTSAPVGAVMCDGSSLNKATYPEAYAIIGDTVAVANNIVPDSAAFIIPDCRSRFSRGTDNGAGRSGYAEQMKYYNYMVQSHAHSLLAWSGATIDTGGSSSSYGIGSNVSGVDGLIGNTGGAETMPMAIAIPKILWVMTPEEVSAAKSNSWWTSTTAPTNYHYSEDTGELLGTSQASPSWKEPGVWLNPHSATHKHPIADKAGHITVFRQGEWKHDADLFLQRQEEALAAQRSREDENTALMQKSQAREQFDASLKAAGLPFTIEDISKLL